MQADEGDLVFTPSILDTPSLMTPNIVLTAPTIKSNYDPLHTSNESLSTSNASSIITNETSSTASSADAKVSKIEDQLKRSLTEARKPTPSPFETISTTRSVFILDKPTSVEDGTTIEIPSTADVKKRRKKQNGFFEFINSILGSQRFRSTDEYKSISNKNINE
jgi:hypothetical protein